MSHSIAIPLSKAKVQKNLWIAVLFLVAGVFFVSKPYWFIRSTNTTVITVVGYGIMILSALISIVLLKKLNDKKPGLLIDGEGILDNFSGVAAGKIYWKDVRKISTEIVSGQSFIMIHVKNPNDYLRAQKNPIKVSMMELNQRLYQTPLNISANGLKINITDLYESLQQQFEMYKNR